MGTTNTNKTPWDRPPAWTNLQQRTDDALAAVRVANREALLLAVQRADVICPELARAISLARPFDRGLARVVAGKVELSSEVLDELLKAGSRDAYQALLQRPDTPSDALVHIARHASDVLLGDLCEKVVMHPNCSEAAVEVVFSRVKGAWYTGGIFNAAAIPRTAQEIIASNSQVDPKRRLLLHPSVAPDLVPKLLDDLLQSTHADFVAFAVSHPALSRAKLEACLYSQDHRIAAAAADRIAELAGTVRISDFVKFHAGSRSGAICSWATKRMPVGLGLFVVVCHFARDVLLNRPQDLLDLVIDAYEGAHSAALHDALACTPKTLAEFRQAMALLPDEARRRLVAGAIRNGEVSEDLMANVAYQVTRDGAGEVLARLRWRRIRTLTDLQLKIRDALELRGMRRKLLRPFFRARWLVHLERARLSTGHRVVVPRTKTALLRLGAALSVCLADVGQQYAERVYEGKAVVFGVWDRGRPVYAFQTSVDGRSIVQAKGKLNAEAPASIVGEVKALIAAAVEREKAASAPSPPAALAPDGFPAW